MRIRDLGSPVVEVDGHSSDLGSTRQGALLTRLLLELGRAVPTGALIAAAWGPDAVVSMARLDSQLWRLRNLLEPNRGRSSSVLVKSSSGYRLTAGPDEVDSARFTQLAHQVMGAAGSGPSPEHTVMLIDEALSLWRGRPYESISELPDIAPAIARLDQLRDALTERRIDALIGSAQQLRALADLGPLIASTPYREQLWVRRIEILARLGRTEEALSTYQRIRGLLRDELGLDPGPELTRLHAGLLSGNLTAAAQPPPTLPEKAPRPVGKAVADGGVHLPRRATQLVGRSGDLNRIRLLVSDYPLVTVVGAGGCGKTRLAIEVATDVATEYPDGVWFVDLTAVVDPSLLPDVVSSTLGLGSSALDDPLLVVGDYLADKRALLVMDNCEHVLSGAAGLVESILGTGGTATVLATSREPLEVDGEVVWSLSPLSLLETPDRPAESHGRHSPAVELFLERSRAAAPDRSPESVDLRLVNQICRAVDGLPLAIELAAARIRMFSLSEIAEQVDSDPSTLGRIGHRRNVAGGDERRGTLYDAIEWSYRLLDEPEQALHRRLSILPGDFSLVVARGVAAPDREDHGGADVAGRLAALVHSSMLVARRPDGEVTRFSQLDTVRAHARRQLAEHGEDRALAHHRDDWVRALLRRRPRAGTSPEPAWFDELDDAYDLIRACLQDQVRRDGDPELVRLGADLAFYWYYRSRIVEGGRWLQSALDHGPAAGNGIEAGLRTIRLAAVHFLRTRSDLARPVLDRGLAQITRVGDDELVAVVETIVGVAGAAWGCEEYELMGRLHELLLPLVGRAADPQLDVLTEMIGCISRLLVAPLEVSKAESAALFDRAGELGNPFVQWMAALLRTGVATIEQNPVDGISWTKRLVPIHLRFGHGGGSVFLESLGNYAAMSEEFDEAARFYAAGAAASRRAGTGWPNRPQTPPLIERTRSALGADFAAASAAGVSLTLEQVAHDWQTPEEPTVRLRLRS